MSENTGITDKMPETKKKGGFYMGETYRVMEHPILEELREPDTYIIYDGKKIPAVSGEPVAAALLAAGVRIMRHTEKRISQEEFLWNRSAAMTAKWW